VIVRRPPAAPAVLRALRRAVEEAQPSR
jgi:hypothetical protein